MNEKAIAISAFFITIFLLYQVRLIVRLRRLRKINSKVTGNRFFLGVLAYNICECCCGSLCCLGKLGSECIDMCFGEKIDETVEKIVDRKTAADERKIEEKKAREQKKYLTKIEQEKIGRKERIEKLRASDYTAPVEDKNNLLKIVSMHTKTSLSWTSDSTNLPIEEIVLIIEHEPDFEIRDEYIINKKKMQEKEIAKITCPNCENLFEQGSEFCPNCGHDLKN